MKDREIQCGFYICEGQCAKGRAGTFYDYCQVCNLYKAKRFARPARTDTRQQRTERAERKEKYDY